MVVPAAIRVVECKGNDAARRLDDRRGDWVEGGEREVEDRPAWRKKVDERYESEFVHGEASYSLKRTHRRV